MVRRNITRRNYDLWVEREKERKRERERDEKKNFFFLIQRTNNLLRWFVPKESSMRQIDINKK